MSTLLPRTAPDLEPVSEAELVGYFRAGSKPRAAWRVGIEFEKFALDRDSGKQIGFDEGIEAILTKLVAGFGWEPHREAGRLTTLSRGGSMISIEPGGQLELSTPPSENIAELHADLTWHLAELRAVTDPTRVAWCAAGVSPVSAVEAIALNPRPRHQLMAEYLPRHCPHGLHMMKATASTQVTFDYADEADAGCKFAVALRLSPVVNAAFANAPLHAGIPSGFASFRGHIWHGMDPARSGFVTRLLASTISFAEWTHFALDVPLLFVSHGTSLLPAPGGTFRDWLHAPIAGRAPTLHDWEIHLSTIFTEARLKQFLEIRGADATPSPLALAVPAIWKGLLYDPIALSAAVEVAQAFPPHELPALSEAAARTGLAATQQGRPPTEWLRELVELAQAGLERLGGSEARFLEPLHEVVKVGQSPGTRWANAATVAEILAACEYPL